MLPPLCKQTSLMTADSFGVGGCREETGYGGTFCILLGRTLDLGLMGRLQLGGPWWSHVKYGLPRPISYSGNTEEQGLRDISNLLHYNGCQGFKPLEECMYE